MADNRPRIKGRFVTRKNDEGGSNDGGDPNEHDSTHTGNEMNNLHLDEDNIEVGKVTVEEDGMGHLKFVTL